MDGLAFSCWSSERTRILDQTRRNLHNAAVRYCISSIKREAQASKLLAVLLINTFRFRQYVHASRALCRAPGLAAISMAQPRNLSLNKARRYGCDVTQTKSAPQLEFNEH